jgi:iron(III) transport system substrate-binding protein
MEMVSMMRRKWPVAVLIAGTLALGGCGSPDDAPAESLPSDAAAAGGLDELVQKAQAEGELSLYAGTTEKATTAWARAFTAEYGIEVKLYRDGSSTLYQKWAQEVQGGVDNADILIHNIDQMWAQAADEGWITDYKTQNYDGFDYDTVMRNADVVGSVYPLHQSIGAVVWNTDVVTAEQQQLLERDPIASLADPAFKGQIALGDVGGATNVGNYADVIYHQSDKYGWDWLDGVADNDPALFESQVPMAEQLVKGEYAVTFSTDTLYNDYIEQGAPIEYRYPDPTSSALWMIGLPTKTPHPYAARLFMEWATSPEGHDLMAELGAGTGTRTGWEDSRVVSEEPWYEPPNPWYGMSELPELQGDGFGDFVARVYGTLFD